ncbi:hypothetical protein [Paenibacillus sp. FJAT-26967]|uniref:hypothetical protein n=1 Tax=Paenibacillus sp. FJAT-26967 TaxID=1729690 RepID=UPI000A907D86|nr:hypothetical protein [Paenibacillus sp. FJAT-26967]
MNKKMMFTAVGLGAAYLMRNKDARDKLIGQFQNFATQSKSTPASTTRTSVN